VSAHLVARRVPRVLAAIGRAARAWSAFLLRLAALAAGVAGVAPRPSVWRRTVRTQFRRSLIQALGGGLASTVFTAALVGLAMVSQAIYWLGSAGQEGLIGPILVTVLVRELTPVLVGLILLGRSGTVAITELGGLGETGGERAMLAQGLDTFEMLVLPRATALATASFTLGVVFVVVALLTGFVAGSLLGALEASVFDFFDQVLRAMHTRDFAIFPVKMLIRAAGCRHVLSHRPFCSAGGGDDGIAATRIRARCARDPALLACA
jgi:phospholipid/cholesterol/gamma-HCH transport system permease protein